MPLSDSELFDFNAALVFDYDDAKAHADLVKHGDVFRYQLLAALFLDGWVERLQDDDPPIRASMSEEEIPGWITEIWEWADFPLHELLGDEQPESPPDGAVEQIEANVGAALACLHSIGVIHCDVAPNNIFRVDGVWKLGDLDSCVARGKPTNRGPTNRRYLHPERLQSPGPIPLAREEFDTWALDQVLERLRERGWQ
jgi:hypothetical protein